MNASGAPPARRLLSRNRVRSVRALARGGHGALPVPVVGTPAPSRRVALLLAAGSLASATPARAEEQQELCDFTQTLPCDPVDKEYTRTPSGLYVRELRYGAGDAPRAGDRVVADWDAYTFYLQHVVAAKNLSKGGAFAGDGEDDGFLRWSLGDGTVIGALDEAVAGMRVGGIRRIIVHPGTGLSYPGILDKAGGRWEPVGPRPPTNSGRRALDFVLRNTANVDKSLLFDVELLGVGEGARAVRGPGEWADGLGR